LIEIEQQRAEAGVDPLSELLQAQLAAKQLGLKRLHLETRAGTLMQQLVGFTGLPPASVNPDHASIPDIPQIRAHEPASLQLGIEAAQSLARSKEKQARGDALFVFLPQAVVSMQYNRFTTLLNNADSYYFVQHKSGGYSYVHLKPDNFSSGVQINVPLFDWVHRDKAKESAAEALRARVEVEQAQRQSDVQIAQLTGSLRELDTLAEIASLKQQIAQEQVKAVEAQLESGNGASSGPNAQPQLSPKAEQLARIDERQKFQDSLDASLDLSKTRLNLLRALGHMEDWLGELHGK
jgi:outer membrane protein TolC